MTSSAIKKKYRGLIDLLAGMENVAVAFSGGVDSTLLLHAAREALGENVLAVTLSTPYTPRWEIEEAREFAEAAGVRHRVVEVKFPEEIRNNPEDRCYLCKRILFSRIIELAEAEGIPHVIEGTNVDDLGDHRPGLKAIRELAVRSPLLEAGLAKAEIRELSRELGLPTWGKPALACLMTRIPFGERVEEETLRRIEAAETFLMGIGFDGVRVRSHGDVARIEVPEDRIGDLVAAEKPHGITTKLKALGYRHVAVDLAGYRMGGLNPAAPEGGEKGGDGE